MADKTVGMLENVPSLHDESLIPVEQSGELMNVTGKQFREFAEASVKPYSDSAVQAALTAAGCEAGAQQAWTGVQNAIKNIPSGSTPIVNDLTTGGAKMALSAEQGKVLGKRPNPNIIKNWYMPRVVNRAAKQVYTGYGAVFDLWTQTAEASVTTTLLDTCVQLKATPDNAGFWHYAVANERVAPAGTYTISALCGVVEGRALVQFRIVDPNDATKSTGGGFIELQTGLNVITRTLSTPISSVLFQVDAGASLEVIAIKLECGTVQTLAYPDANGSLILCDVPDYATIYDACSLYNYRTREYAGRPQHARNLVVNGDFQALIDQKNGYIVPPDIQAFSDPELTKPVNPTSNARRVIERTETYCKFVSGSYTYYAAPEAAVRGYIGNAYTVDMWRSGGVNMHVRINNQGISLVNVSTTSAIGLNQAIPQLSVADAGRAYTAAFMLADGTILARTFKLPTTSYVNVVTTDDGVSLRMNPPDSAGTGFASYYRLGVVVPRGQTADIAWIALYEGVYSVDNLPPIHTSSEAVSRIECQRNQFVAQGNGVFNLCNGFATTTTMISFFLPVPTSLRTFPAISFQNLFAKSTASEESLPITAIANYGTTANGIWLAATVAGAELGKPYYLRTQGQFYLICDANW